MNVEQFIEEYCEIGGRTPASELYEAYKGLGGLLSPQSFGRSLTRLGYPSESSNGIRMRKGLCLRADPLREALQGLNLRPLVYFECLETLRDGGSLWLCLRDADGVRNYCLDGGTGSTTRGVVYYGDCPGGERLSPIERKNLLTLLEAMCRIGGMGKTTQSERFIGALKC